jgi:hypothetical protein
MNKSKVHFFNCKIKDGNSGKAIKLLEIKGYPESIVQYALKLSKELSSKGYKQT